MVLELKRESHAAVEVLVVGFHPNQEGREEDLHCCTTHTAAGPIVTRLVLWDWEQCKARSKIKVRRS